MVKSKKTKTLPLVQRIESLENEVADTTNFVFAMRDKMSEAHRERFAKERRKREKQLDIMYYVYYGIVAFVVIISLIKLKKGQ